MIKIIVMGHGTYAEGVKGNIEMLSGIPDNMYFLDLSAEGGLSKLEKDLDDLLDEIKNEEILFVCDLMGASPFRVAAMKCVMNPSRYSLITGLNTMAFVELSMYDQNLSLDDLTDHVMTIAKDAIIKFSMPVE